MGTTAVGIDGCKAGWFYFSTDGNKISYGVDSSFHNLANSLPNDSRVFIDIPIGLIDRGAKSRGCDKEARKLLGWPKASSVFPAPCRPVLEAKNYEKAKKISVGAIGKKLTKQTFAIVPKIKEVDDFLRKQSHNISVREVHPEVCFWALNNRKPVVSRKKDKKGFDERLDLLGKFVPVVKYLIDEVKNSYPRKDVALDDLLDALVAMVVADTSDEFLQTIPKVPDIDSLGLPMEMVFTERPNINKGVRFSRVN